MTNHTNILIPILTFSTLILVACQDAGMSPLGTNQGQEVAELELLAKEGSTLLTGDRTTVTLAARDGAGRQLAVAPSDVTWSSSDPTIAIVSEAGEISTSAEGTVTISAVLNQATASIEVTVIGVDTRIEFAPAVAQATRDAIDQIFTVYESIQSGGRIRIPSVPEPELGAIAIAIDENDDPVLMGFAFPDETLELGPVSTTHAILQAGFSFTPYGFDGSTVRALVEEATRHVWYETLLGRVTAAAEAGTSFAYDDEAMAIATRIVRELARRYMEPAWDAGAESAESVVSATNPPVNIHDKSGTSDYRVVNNGYLWYHAEAFLTGSGESLGQTVLQRRSGHYTPFLRGGPTETVLAGANGEVAIKLGQNETTKRYAYRQLASDVFSTVIRLVGLDMPGENEIAELTISLFDTIMSEGLTFEGDPPSVGGAAITIAWLAFDNRRMLASQIGQRFFSYLPWWETTGRIITATLGAKTRIVISGGQIIHEWAKDVQFYYAWATSMSAVDEVYVCQEDDAFVPCVTGSLAGTYTLEMDLQGERDGAPSSCTFYGDYVLTEREDGTYEGRILGDSQTGCEGNEGSHIRFNPPINADLWKEEEQLFANFSNANPPFVMHVRATVDRLSSETIEPWVPSQGASYYIVFRARRVADGYDSASVSPLLKEGAQLEGLHFVRD